MYAAGDRLSACKGQMKPVGLTMKMGRNKYRLDHRGELMLVHQCNDCGTLSINRIAADDDASTIMTVFLASIGNAIHKRCEEVGIITLKSHDVNILHKQLYGEGSELFPV
jgi:hypothetical protein